MRLYLFLLSLSTIALFSCSQSADKRTVQEQRSFCYWNTSFRLDTTLCNATGVNHFYIRYFDVDWDPVSEQAKPIATIDMNDSMPVHFTPAVFFTNKVFEKSSKEQLKLLSSRVKKRIEEVSNNFGYTAYYKSNRDKMYESISIDSVRWAKLDSARRAFADEYQSRYSEVLIDCDWTAGTRDNFFYFLKCLKQDFQDKNITATLRLWQYKQNKTADIPPVNRCLLMCYNMQAANDHRVQNSIASLDELKKYVSGKKYPLTLDVALPLFSWAVLFRNEKYIGLLGNASEKEFADNVIEYESLGSGRYRILTDKVMGNYFARKGDIIRVEEIGKELLHQMADYLKSEIPMDKYSRITFFSWNESYINKYGTDEIKNIYTLYSK